MKLLAILFIILLLPSTANAISIGVSPSSVIFVNVLREGYAERTITITTASDETVFGHIETDGEAGQWLRFLPNSTLFNVTRAKPYRLTIIVEPPADIGVGSYSGAVYVVADTEGSVSGRAGSVVKTASKLTLNVDVTGDEIRQCSAGAFDFMDIEEGFPIEFLYSIENTGNVRLSPEIELDFWDQAQDRLVYSTSVDSAMVQPTKNERLNVRLPNNLEIGQYWVDVKVDECSFEGLHTFSVVEKGSLIDRGELVEIVLPRDAYVGETVQVLASFVNRGERLVNAQFKGTATRNNRVEAVLESDEVIIEPGQSAQLASFFTPEKPGRYEVAGRVIYNKKLSFEKAAILTVNGDGQGLGIITPLLLYAIVAVSAFFMVRKLKRKKTRRF